LLFFIIVISIVIIIMIIVIGVQVFTEAEVRASLVFQVSKLCSFMLKAARIATGGAAWDALVAGLPVHPLLVPHTSWAYGWELRFRGSKTSPQCRNAFLLSPDVSEFRFQCRDDVSESK